MRPGSVFSEAGRNLATGTSRALLFALFLAAVTSGLAIMDARSVIGTERAAETFASSGASVQVLVAQHTTDPAACDRLRAVTGIRAAGALREADALVLRSMISNPVTAYAVTPGFIEVLGGSQASPAGVWLPAPLAQALAVRPGQQLATTAGTLTVAGVYAYPDDGRDSRLAYAALLPQPATGAFDECWADIWPVSRATNDQLYAAITVDTTSTDPVSIRQLNPALGTAFSGRDEFGARPTRWALPACALAGLVAGLLAVRLRRLEIAGALHLGESRRALLGSLLIETLTWSLAALIIADGALVFGVALASGGSLSHADLLDVYLVDARAPAGAAAGAVAGAVLALLTIREKHLFKYFRNR